MIEHTASLPYGFQVLFGWVDGKMIVLWKPDVPVIGRARQRRKFFKAYSCARAEFLEMVAAAIGGSVAVVDVEAGDATLSAIIDPPRYH